MPNGYRYFGRWNFDQDKPVPNRSWIDEAEARHRYESRSGPFSLVNAEAGDGTVVPRFVVTASSGSAPSFVCKFFNQAGSVTRVISYRNVEGRLFKDQVADYVYPDDEHRYTFSDCTLSYTGFFRPDGYGAVIVNDKSQPTEQHREYRDVPIEGNWMPVPAFGEWDNLINPDHEAPEADRPKAVEPA